MSKPECMQTIKQTTNFANAFTESESAAAHVSNTALSSQEDNAWVHAENKRE